ncbi:MAG: extracellular solute-binding protein [Clostridiales bacterium]|nr:extracellular solute-binding protein [Clostridiales bacterium]
MKKLNRIFSVAVASVLLCAPLSLTACSTTENEDTVVLRVANWEEYIDLGGWDEEELIDIDNPYNQELGGVFGENALIDDYVEWFNAQDFGFNVSVEYSTFGTNEDLYNRLNLGDVYDLVCPSDYMIMKLIAENKVEKFSQIFKDSSVEGNYYAQNVSKYIDCSDDSVFYKYGWQDYAACYMWGTTGFAYNPEIVDAEDVASWNILTNPDYNRKVTVKDNVRDAYFAALGILNGDDVKGLDNESLSLIMNDTSDEVIQLAQDILKDIKDNVYSFETDSGKADMVTGKVAANFQWSGDAVYILDEAEADGVELWYSVPEACTNLWFDGWIMLKDGIDGNEQRKIAAEAFVNFLSRPDNAVRNMYYIGYTSAIAGDLMFEYLDWNYGFDFESEEEVESLYEYDLSHFFGEGYSLIVDASSLDITGANEEIRDFDGEQYKVLFGGEISRGRQLFAQYSPKEVIDRSVVMMDFGDKISSINQMWINVRCQDLLDINPVIVLCVVGAAVAITLIIVIYKFRYSIFKSFVRPGYKKVD